MYEVCTWMCACDLVTLRTKSIRLFLVSCGGLSQLCEHTAALCSLSLQQDWTEFEEQKQEKPQVTIKVNKWMEKKRGEKPKRCKDKSFPTSHQLGHDSPSFVVSMVSCSLWSNWGSSPNLLPIPVGGKVRNRGPWCCASTVQPELQHCYATNTESLDLECSTLQAAVRNLTLS